MPQSCTPHSPCSSPFNLNKYRTKKPVPLNNTYVSIEGFLKDVEIDFSGRANAFCVSVDNINHFLGKPPLLPLVSGNTSIVLKYLFVFILNTVMQRPPCHHSHPALNLILTSLLAHPLMPQFWIRFLQHLSLNRVYSTDMRMKENKID